MRQAILLAFNAGVSKEAWGYKWGYKSENSNVKDSIHTGYKASLERFRPKYMSKVDCLSIVIGLFHWGNACRLSTLVLVGTLASNPRAGNKPGNIKLFLPRSQDCSPGPQIRHWRITLC